MKHQGPISGIAAHDNFVATAGYDNQLILWDKLSGLSIACGHHDHLVNQVCFSPDGSKIASSSSDYTVRIWDVPSLKLRTVIGHHLDDVEMAAFSPNGKWLATCSRDRLIRVFDIQGTLIVTMQGHIDDVVSVCWSSDSQHVLSSSDDGTVFRWDSRSGKQIQKYEFDGVQTDTLIVTSQNHIILGDDNGQLIVIHNGKQTKIKAHKAGVKRLVINSNHGFIASLSYDRSLAIWKITKDSRITEISRTEFPAIVWPRSGAFLDCYRIAIGTFGSCYAIYDIDKKQWQLDGISKYKSFNAVCTYDDSIYAIGDSGTLYKDKQPISELGSLCNFLLCSNRRIISGGQLGKLFDAVSGELLHQHHSPINCGTVFQRDGIELAAFGTYTGEILVMNLLSQPIHVTTHKIHDNAIKGITANSNYLFSVSASAEAIFTEISSLTVSKKIEHAHNKIINGCITTHDCFVSISRDLYLSLWYRKKKLSILSPHKNSIKCLSTDSSERLIATGSYTGVIFVFDIQCYKWIYGIRPTSFGISSITFSHEKKSFIASSYDGSLYYLSLQTILSGPGTAFFLAEKKFLHER